MKLTPKQVQAQRAQLNQFLTRLRKDRGDYGLPYGWNIIDRGEIRRISKEGLGNQCPITAIAGGVEDNALACYRKAGLTKMLAFDIMDAADDVTNRNSTPRVPAVVHSYDHLRRRLLSAVGLA